MEAWLEPVYDATGMRAVGRLGDRGAAGAVARADGDGGRGGGRGGPLRGAPRARCGSSAARATTAATGSSPLGSWPTPATRSRRSCCGPRPSSRPTPSANLERFEGASTPGRPGEVAGGARGLGRGRGRDLRHRVLGRAARAGGRRDRGDQRLRRPRRRGRHRLRRRRLDGRGGGSGGARPTSR